MPKNLPVIELRIKYADGIVETILHSADFMEMRKFRNQFQSLMKFSFYLIKKSRFEVRAN